nr:MAG TPA: hypothetical protein [Caudoviricetes sp.]
MYILFIHTCNRLRQQSYPKISTCFITLSNILLVADFQ